MSDLELPVLDPRSEIQLVEQALVRVFNASNGTINDFSASSVVRALVEGQAFGGAELLYFVNKLPLALVVQFLQVAGVIKRDGTAAIVTLTFTLSASIGNPFTIPQGFEVTDASGDVAFATDTQLVIPAGSIEGTVTATCVDVGSAGNLAAFTITNIIQPLAFLAGAINLEAASGGTDAETQDAAIARGLAAIRLRNLVSRDDYEKAAVDVLGMGSVAHAIGLLGQDRISFQRGAVHLFCLNANSDTLTQAQINLVQSIESRIQLGTSLYVSSLDVVDIDGDLVANLAEDQDPNAAAETLWESFQAFLDPALYSVGESVILKEAEYRLRLSGVISSIQALTLNNNSTNLPMPFPYSVPSAHSLYCTLIDSEGTVYQILQGAGEDYVG